MIIPMLQRLDTILKLSELLTPSVEALDCLKEKRMFHLPFLAHLFANDKRSRTK